MDTTAACTLSALLEEKMGGSFPEKLYPTHPTKTARFYQQMLDRLFGVQESHILIEWLSQSYPGTRSSMITVAVNCQLAVYDLIGFLDWAFGLIRTYVLAEEEEQSAYQPRRFDGNPYKVKLDDKIAYQNLAGMDGISVRTCNRLGDIGVYTPGQLAVIPYNTLKDIRGIGKKSLWEIRNLFEMLGLRFVPERGRPHPEPVPSLTVQWQTKQGIPTEQEAESRLQQAAEILGVEMANLARALLRYC